LIHWESSNSIQINIIYIFLYFNLFLKHWYVKFLQYQWGWVLNVINCWSHFCLKKEAYPIFLMILKTGQTTESVSLCGWLTLKFIYFQIIISFCFKFFYNCNIPWILQLLCSLIWILLTHFQCTMHGMKLNET
jgi:hypothetical protein